MSETHRGAGWWQASDLHWYPPESHPDHRASLPPPPIGYVPVNDPDSTTRPQDSTARGPWHYSNLQSRHVMIIVVCLAYVFSPIDLVPELLLGPLGMPDDLIAVVASAGALVAGLRPKHVPEP